MVLFSLVSVCGFASNFNLFVRLYHDYGQQITGQKEKTEESKRGEGRSRCAQYG